MKQLRTHIALLLAALMILTSGHMAAARGNVGVAGQIVICTGLGVKLINVDRHNQPVGPTYHCPECVLAALDLATGADPFQTLRKPSQTHPAKQFPPLWHVSPRPVGHPRGPPALI